MMLIFSNKLNLLRLTFLEVYTGVYTVFSIINHLIIQTHTHTSPYLSLSHSFTCTPFSSNIHRIISCALLSIPNFYTKFNISFLKVGALANFHNNKRALAKVLMSMTIFNTFLEQFSATL